MSTQFDTPIVDLDRTDELPVLDVEAYEASLVAKSLSGTDTWAVHSLRALDDEADDESVDLVPSSTAVRPSVRAEALTTNVERILSRIAELEAEVVATHEINARLQKDGEALRAEAAARELRIDALQADKARLCEQRVQSDENTDRLGQKLRERAESIEALEKSLGNEKDLVSHLSRQMAAKLMDCEKAVSIIELRNRAIEDLTRDGLDLSQRLQQETATSADLTARLAAAEHSLHESRAQLLEHEDVIGNKNSQLALTHAQIRSLTEERDALRSASAQLEARTADLEQKNVQLAQLRSELVAARAEAHSQTKLLNERTDELGTLHNKFNERETAHRELAHAMQTRAEQTEDLKTKLQTACDERAIMGTQLDKALTRVKTLTDLVFGRDNQIAALQADLAVHTEMLATIQRDVSRIGARPGAKFGEVEHMLEPIEHDGPTLYLTGKVLTVGRTSDNDISIPSKLVSRCHARLLVGPTGVIIEDADSTNGCFVNGKQVRQHLLRDSDVLELGELRYRMRTRAVRDIGASDTKLRQLPSATRKSGARLAN
jgi:DNA repair exonuclease SbcCD ATPase subunit